MPWESKETKHKCNLPLPDRAAMSGALQGSTYKCDDGCGKVHELRYRQTTGWWWSADKQAEVSGEGS